MAGRTFRRPPRPASSFKFQPTRASRLAQAVMCATMNPGIDPESFKRTYGFTLAEILKRIDDGIGL